jgi:hypothetical protein
MLRNMGTSTGTTGAQPLIAEHGQKNDVLGVRGHVVYSLPLPEAG